MVKDFFLKKLAGLPKIFWIYTAVILLAEIIVLALRPDEPGLYTFLPQFAPLALAFVFLPFKKIRVFFTRWLYTYSLLSFIFLAIDYNSFNYNGAGHAGLVHIATTFLPAGLFWIFKFICWNVRRIKEGDSRTALILSTFAWGLYALAFPPLPLGPAALLLLVPWFITLNHFGRQQALFATFWSAVVYNTINYYWIYNVMNVETAPSGLILFGLFLLIAYFSAYNVLAAFIYTIVKNIRIKGFRILLWIYPVFYAGIEMTRTRGDFSFPWSHLGYVFGNHVEFLQMLPWIGIFGYTILVVASNQVVAYGFERLSAAGFRDKQELKKTIPVLSIPAIILLVLFLQGSYVLSKPEAAPFYDADNEENPSIALVQPSIAQGAKWSKERFDNIVNKTLGMVKDSVAVKTDLIVLAETAIPDYIRRQPNVIRRLHRLSDEMQGSILTGTLDYKRNDPGSIRKYDIYNSAFLFTPNDNSFPQRYIKKHLVPFSERIPFDDIFPILNYVDLGEGDFVTGKETPVYGPFKWTPYICYDAIFGDLVREAIREGSRLMVNITNDGWFGKSTAPYQHMNLIRYRAIENGMPVARLANSGVSLFIDQYGHYGQNTDIFVDAVIQRKMPLKTRDTLYSHIGDTVETTLLWFFLIYLVTSLVFFFKFLKTSRIKA